MFLGVSSFSNRDRSYTGRMVRTERLPEAGFITFNQYQELAHQTSLLDTLPDAHERILMKTIEESVEVFHEDGLSDRFHFLYGWYDIEDAEKAGIAKEFGDLLWFISEDATRSGMSLGQLAQNALGRHVAKARAVDRIRDFDRLSTTNGPAYEVINYKLRAYLADPEKRELAVTTIEENPGYVLQRVLGRLACRLDPVTARKTIYLSNLSFEDEALWLQAPEDALWVMSAVGNMYLKKSLAQIAVDNLTKVFRRQQAGTLLEGADSERSGQS